MTTFFVDEKCLTSNEMEIVMYMSMVHILRKRTGRSAMIRHRSR